MTDVASVVIFLLVQMLEHNPAGARDGHSETEGVTNILLMGRKMTMRLLRCQLRLSMEWNSNTKLCQH